MVAICLSLHVLTPLMLEMKYSGLGVNTMPPDALAEVAWISAEMVLTV